MAELIQCALKNNHKLSSVCSIITGLFLCKNGIASFIPVGALDNTAKSKKTFKTEVKEVHKESIM